MPTSALTKPKPATNPETPPPQNPMIWTMFLALAISVSGLRVWLDPASASFLPELGWIAGSLAWVNGLVVPLSIFSNGTWVRAELRGRRRGGVGREGSGEGGGGVGERSGGVKERGFKEWGKGGKGVRKRWGLGVVGLEWGGVGVSGASRCVVGEREQLYTCSTTLSKPTRLSLMYMP